MNIAHPADPALALLALILVLQLAWFSVTLARRGATPANLRLAVPPFVAVWALMWPVHADLRWLWAGLAALTLPCALAMIGDRTGWRFWRELRRIWSPPDAPAWMPPMFRLLASLAIAAAWMETAPEFGFGLALCATLALPAADIVDRFAAPALGFPAHPGQTLPGHLASMALATLLLAWSLQVWHHLPWSPILIPTLIAALAGSVARALVPGEWHAPAAILAMGATLNLL